jgi:hypothetical protein
MTPLGVWVCYYYDIGAIVESIHWDEMSARRKAGQEKYLHVAFVEFDKDFSEQATEYEKKAREESK